MSKAMSRFGSLATVLILFTQVAAHAAPGSDDKKTIDLGVGCEGLDLGPARKPGTSLAPIALPKQLEGTIYSKIVNGTREIALHKYSPMYSDNREQQVAAAKELAKEIGRGIFDLIGDPEQGDQIQEFIMTKLGQIPQESLATLRQILEGESLAKLSEKKAEKSISDRTDNALADIAKVLSTFREKTGDKTVDVNTAANAADKVGGFLSRFRNLNVFAGLAKDTGKYVRENYQDAVQVIDLNKKVLTDGILYQQHLQDQYRYARLESQILAAYIDMSLIVTEELRQMFQEAIDRSDLNQNQLDWVNKTIISPIQTVRAMLRDAALTNLSGYLTFGQLMDRNLAVIAGLYYTRASSDLKMTIGAAAKHGIRKLDDKIDLINTISDIGNQIQRDNVAGLAALGKRTHQMLERMITDQQSAVELAGLLIETIEDIRKGEAKFIPQLDKVDVAVKAKTAELMAKGMALESIDKIKLVEDVTKDVTGRSTGETASAPTEPALKMPAQP